MRVGLARYLLGFLFFLVGLQGEEVQAKVVYVKVANLQELTGKPVYIGQRISVQYRLMLFSQAKFLGAALENLPDPKKLQRINFTPTWLDTGNGTFSATYDYKVLGTKAVVPALKVSAFVQNQGYLDKSSAPAIPLQVVDLSAHPNYTGVVAQSFKLVGYKVKEYDTAHNILVFELQTKGANLEDFKIPGGFKQGFESSRLGAGDASGVYYCILPKGMQNLSFNYFSLQEAQFKELHFSLIPIEESVSTQSNLKPKNNLLLFSNIFLMTLLLVVVVCYFLTSYKNATLVVAVLLLGVLLWNILSTYRTGILRAQAAIKILPTQNSTLLAIPKEALHVKIIGEHAKYYKIMTDDEKIGWVRKEDVE
ncbi:Putative periplasmic protein [Helicobacter ailurogastricus]|nr:Putative periplasmic protein [Helicobacter ailurogastricus]GLH58819.1 Putative periplasmic protein [Helicobacter ailurogastricus]